MNKIINLFQIQWGDAPIQPSMDPITPSKNHYRYFEMPTITNFIEYNDIVSNEFYGFFSPKFLQKMNYSSEEFSIILDQFKQSDSEILIFEPYLHNSLIYKNPLSVAQFNHNLPIDDTNQAKEIYDQLAINLGDPRLPPRYWTSCSFFICRGDRLKEFRDFYKPIISWLLEKEVYTKETIHTGYLSPHGSIETHVPFVFERLMSYFLWSNKHIRFTHSNQILKKPIKTISVNEVSSGFLSTMEYIITYCPEVVHLYDDCYLHDYICRACASGFVVRFDEIFADRFHYPKLEATFERCFLNVNE